MCGDLSSGANGENIDRAETCAESSDKIRREGFGGEELGAITNKGSRVSRGQDGALGESLWGS